MGHGQAEQAKGNEQQQRYNAFQCSDEVIIQLGVMPLRHQLCAAPRYSRPTRTDLGIFVGQGRVSGLYRRNGFAVLFVPGKGSKQAGHALESRTEAVRTDGRAETGLLWECGCGLGLQLPSSPSRGRWFCVPDSDGAVINLLAFAGRSLLVSCELSKACSRPT